MSSSEPHPIRKDVFHIFKAVENVNVQNPPPLPEDRYVFDDDLEFHLPEMESGATIVLDFAVSNAAIVEYTLKGRDVGPWIALNNGAEVMGGQSRYIRITDKTKLNFRTNVSVTFERFVVGEV